MCISGSVFNSGAELPNIAASRFLASGIVASRAASSWPDRFWNDASAVALGMLMVLHGAPHIHPHAFSKAPMVKLVSSPISGYVSGQPVYDFGWPDRSGIA
jgi:hypothetical protein